MLALTDNAVSVIRDLAATTQTPDTTGVRIAVAQDQEQLSLALTPAASDGDQVVEDQGARVYLEQEAASMLADRTLDAAVEQDGSVQFFVATSPQA
ncbi:MAG: Fe-S cluster assembly protein HesB [Streptosporangiales bacterium]|nr:Fe-S cluster assembly protein HesB [Streptosporangiales bacterium]MBO0890265.1 hypothetical protein [Acidothermales bacterium]